MAFFAVFSNTTGEVVRWGQCPDDDVEAQLSPGYGVVVVDSQIKDGASLYVEDGELVTKPPRPSAAHEWDWASKAWTLNLTLAKEQKWAAMKLARAAEKDSVLVTPHGTFDADEAGRNNIAQTVQLLGTLTQLAQAPATIEFTRSDNTTATLTPAQMTEIGVLLGAKVQAAYNKGRTVRQQIDAAQTQQAVDAIGWPA